MSRRWSLGVAVVGLAAAIGCGGEATREPGPPGAEAVVSHRQAVVRWESDWERAFERARSEGRPVLVNFYADWCVWCKRLETTTLRDPKVADLLATRVVPLKLDVDREGREPAARFEVDGLPTLVLLGADGAVLGRFSGYMPPGAFLDTVAGMLAASPGAQS